MARRPPRPPPPLVLVVDDSADQRDLYTQYLRFCGFEVAVAVNGRDALDKVDALRPDLVVMDLSMPLMDGFEATRALKTARDTRHIPVIALTGYASYLPEDWALSAGCSAYLSKPCLPEHLATAVRRALGSAGT